MIDVVRGEPLVSDGNAALSRAEFDRVYRAERTAVHRHLVYLTGDTALAEDLTQETFGRLYERAPADGMRNVRAWLLTVASNLAYNQLRSDVRRRERETRVDAVASTDVDDVLDVRRALAALEPRDRVMLLLRHSGFSYAEIAEAVGIAASSVGTVLARAQRRFREAYTGRDVKE